MNHPITVIVTVLNDSRETNLTLASIRATAGPDVPIIVVDDASSPQLVLDYTEPNTKLIRNPARAGVGASRHIAAIAVQTDYLLIVDSHCRFLPGWYETAVKRITGRPYTVHVARCVGLSPEKMDMQAAIARRDYYQGATINFYGPDANKSAEHQVLECVWLPDHPGDDYINAGAMGACYFMPTDWFFHIGGLSMLRGWGGDEQLLSLKTWLAGGEIRVMKEVMIGHQFRTQAPYETEMWMPVYNKLAIIHTVIPEPHRSRLDFLLGDQPHVRHARNQIKLDAHQILCERAYLQSIFKRDFAWFISFFKLTCP